MTLVCAPVQTFELDDRVDLVEINYGEYKILYDKSKKEKFVDRDWSSLAPCNIASYHNYDTTPDLEEILQKIKKKHPHVVFYKVTTYSRSTLDSLRMLKIQKGGVIGVCMGPLGAITRICAPIFQTPIVYAPLRKEDINADGQILVEELQGIYNFDRLNSKTSIFAVIGDPVDQSIGHVFHNDFFKKKELNGVYVKLPLKAHELKDFFALIHELNFKGLSVTAPLKEAVVPFLHYIDDVAKNIGAVNTIVIKDGKLFGYNTDAEAACTVVEGIIGDIEGKKIVVLGCGGFAKAIIYVLLQKKGDVFIVNRTNSRAQELARLYGCHWESMVPQNYDLLINATSTQMPVPPEFIRSKSHVVDFAICDTDFLKKAKDKECRCENGLSLYRKQALRQQELWYQNGLFD